MAAEVLTDSIRKVLAAAGRDAPSIELRALRTGGNNRVFVVSTSHERVVAKCYYHHPQEPRSRLRAEFFFLEHAWRHDVHCVPKPLGCDATLHIGIYEFVEGRRLEPAEVDEHHVQAAARFFAAMNAKHIRAAGSHLPAASDACLSIAEHIGSVDRRLDRLLSMGSETLADQEGIAFVKDLAAAWATARRGIQRFFKDIDVQLPENQRCLSPSDFGFHNALLRPSGELCFFDFEYAGWDDPAKMIGDFFAHPGLPVPVKHFDAFAAQACAPFADAASIVERARALISVAKFRWCCIILNEFRPEVARRRHFADPNADLETRKRMQLAKARSLYPLAEV